jgi:LuxR family maltose regulon positive regulatory protein
VLRADLIARLRTASEPLISVAAPGGYGKTTLVAQWTDVDPRPSAWLSIREDCDDPTVLMRYLSAALAPLVDVPARVMEELQAVQPRIDPVVVGTLGAALAGAAEPIIVVLDDLHLLTDERGIDAIATLIEHLGSGSRFVLIGRGASEFPLAAARSRGALAEFGIDDLRFDPETAAELLGNVGPGDLDDDDVSMLTECCEGWAAGLYLAALSLAASPPADGDRLPFRGDDRFVTDYFREEVLSAMPPEDHDFLVRSSILDEMWGALCDATLQRSDSGATLERMERSNLLVVPLDHRRGRYRYHHLFQELLQTELEGRFSGEIPELCGRASAWCEDHELPDLAISYAMRGGSVDRVATRLTRFIQQAYVDGRADSVRRWIEWVDDHGSIDEFPEVAVLGSLIMALTGRPIEAERWAASADGLEPSAPEWIHAVRHSTRALMCRDGVEQMRVDADLALGLQSPGSTWGPSTMLFHAESLLLLGEEDSAFDELLEVGERGRALGTAPATCTACSLLAGLTLSRGDLEAAASWIGRALALVDESRLHGYASTALTHATAARVALAQGDHVRSRRSLDEAVSGRPLLTVAIPTFAMRARLEMARSAMGLGDADLARLALDEGADMQRRGPRLGTVVDEFV